MSAGTGTDWSAWRRRSANADRGMGAVGVAADPPQKIVNGPKTLISIAHPECKTALGGSAPKIPCVLKLIHGLRTPQCRFAAIRKSHQMNVVRPGPSDFRRNILGTGRPQPTTMAISKTPLPAPEQRRPGRLPRRAFRPVAAVPNW